MFTLEDVDRAIRPCGGKFILGDQHSESAHFILQAKPKLLA